VWRLQEWCLKRQLQCIQLHYFLPMISHVDFSPAMVFKMAATMYKLDNSTVINVLKIEVKVEDTVQGLLSAPTRVKTMPAIGRSSIIPGTVVVNSQGIFQLVESKGRIFVPQRVLLDSKSQPLMLGASVIERLRLIKDTLEKYPWTNL
jgi:hypothetical protein